MITYARQFIDGQFTEATGPERFCIVNPATEEAIAEVASSTPSDVDAAVAAARDAFQSWSVTPTKERRGILEALAAELDRRTDEMADVMCAEVGTPLIESRELQVGLARHLLQTNIDILSDYDQDAYRTVANSRVFREPVDVVAAISPSNYPLLLSMSKIIPRAGCRLHRGAQAQRRHAVEYPAARRDRHCSRRSRRCVQRRHRHRTEHR